MNLCPEDSECVRSRTEAEILGPAADSNQMK